MNVVKPLFLLTVVGLIATNSFAQGGHVGGGDQCKNEINKHRLEILNWIERDDASELNLSVAKVKGWTYLGSATKMSYKKEMLKVLEPGAVEINCYLDPSRIKDPVAQAVARSEGVSYRAVEIGGKPVTCLNYNDHQGVPHIDCNYDLIMNENSLGNPNYINTHHEFASIAGIEKRTSSPSDMSVSSQLNQFERISSIKLLGRKIIQHAAAVGEFSVEAAELAFNSGFAPNAVNLVGDWMKVGDANVITGASHYNIEGIGNGEIYGNLRLRKDFLNQFFLMSSFYTSIAPTGVELQFTAATTTAQIDPSTASLNSNWPVQTDSDQRYSLNLQCRSIAHDKLICKLIFVIDPSNTASPADWLKYNGKTLSYLGYKKGK